MTSKIAFLVIAISILFVLVVNAAGEDAIESSQTNNESNVNAASSSINAQTSQIILNSAESVEKEGKAVTASFGVYLEIVG